MKQQKSELDVLGAVPLELVVVIGSRRMRVSELLELGEGAVVTLDRGAREPVDVLAGGTLVARGEIVAVGEQYGVRITQALAGET